MGITSLQVCMDSSDWMHQGTILDENNEIDSSSPLTPPSGDDILTCSRPLIERRIRPQHEQSLKCPRCESTHTKFCYYNNYSLSQPRYFCKACRRYWTKGGTLRNIPVGGGCRKNKKVSKKSTNEQNISSSSSPVLINPQNYCGGLMSPSPLNSDHNFNNFNSNPFLEMQFSAMFNNNSHANPNFFLENPQVPFDFMENKYESTLVGGHDFMGSGEYFGGINGGLVMGGGNGNNFQPISSSFGATSSTFDHHVNHPHVINSAGTILESCQRLMLPYENNYNNHLDQNQELDVKPNSKVLSLEWHDNHLQQQACNSDSGKESFGYPGNGIGSSWTGLMSNGYGATNPLV